MAVEITAQMVKELRQKTGAGIMECKEALKETNGDFAAAEKYLREKGILKAEKKSDRITKQGRIGSYIHGEGRIGVLVELNCETDFVARTEEFQYLLKEVAMQIAAMNPLYISRNDVPEDVIEREKEIYRKEAENTGKPPQVIEKIVDGKLEKYFKEFCLLEQQYIRDDSITVEQLLKEYIAKLGENIVVRRFARFVLGE